MSTWRPLTGPGGDRPDPRPVAESLDRMARRLGAPKASVLSAVFAHWDEIVGPSVGANVRPLSLRGRVLIVVTDQPAWASQLRFLVPDLLRRLASIAGEEAVDQVEIRVVPPGSR